MIKNDNVEYREDIVNKIEDVIYDTVEAPVEEDGRKHIHHEDLTLHGDDVPEIIENVETQCGVNLESYYDTIRSADDIIDAVMDEKKNENITILEGKKEVEDEDEDDDID